MACLSPYRGIFMDDIIYEPEGRKNPSENSERSPNMCELSEFAARAENVDLCDVAACLTRQQREKILSGFDLKRLAKIFEDAEMMRTAEAFFKSGLNVSSAARALYMHRNTLTYRLNAIRKFTGLDLRNFDAAVTFKLLHELYKIK